MVKIKIYKSKDGQYFFTISRNQVSTTSETYTRKANALKSARNLAEAIILKGYDLKDLTV